MHLICDSKNVFSSIWYFRALLQHFDRVGKVLFNIFLSFFGHNKWPNYTEYLTITCLTKWKNQDAKSLFVALQESEGTKLNLTLISFEITLSNVTFTIGSTSQINHVSEEKLNVYLNNTRGGNSRLKVVGVSYRLVDKRPKKPSNERARRQTTLNIVTIILIVAPLCCLCICCGTMYFVKQCESRPLFIDVGSVSHDVATIEMY